MGRTPQPLGAASSATLGMDALPRHYPFLRRVARRLLVTHGADVDADDVVQDVVVRVLRRWERLHFADDRALAGYLHRAVVNRARDAHRAGVRWTIIDLDTMSSPRPSALDGLVAEEWRRRTVCALRRLSHTDRRVVVGRVVESLSFDALAASTGRPSPDAARKATARALARLRQQLAD